MATYRSAMGKTVDMSAIVAKNEKVRAVGNVKNLNARGDTIDAMGRIIQPATDKVSNAYGKTVGNRSSHVTNKAQPKIQADTPAELTREELELEESLADDLEVEQIKQQELKETKKK